MIIFVCSIQTFYAERSQKTAYLIFAIFPEQKFETRTKIIEHLFMPVFKFRYPPFLC